MSQGLSTYGNEPTYDDLNVNGVCHMAEKQIKRKFINSKKLL